MPYSRVLAKFLRGPRVAVVRTIECSYKFEIEMMC